MIHVCNNDFRLTSGEVFNYCINWSKASFDISIADIQEQNNVLQICWLCCNNTSKHLGWHAKGGSFIIWFWAKPMCLDELLFRNSLHKELQFCLFKQSILDRLVEPKAFCFLFICQWFSSTSNSFRGNRIWRLPHNEFGLITLLSLILLIRFLAISDSIDGGHVSNRQSNAAYIYIYIYICLYICLLRLRNECHWNSRHFMTWKIAPPWWDSNPRSLDYIPNYIDNRHVSDHQRNVSQVYIYISGGSKPRNCIGKWQKYELQMSNDSHFEFDDLWKMVPFTAWHTAEMDSAQKKHIETIHEVLFLKNAYRSFSRAIFQFFDLTNCDSPRTPRHI